MPPVVIARPVLHGTDLPDAPRRGRRQTSASLRRPARRRGARLQRRHGQQELLRPRHAYGLLEEPTAGPVAVVTRMDLSAAEKRGDLEAVRDTVLRRALLDLWDEVAAAKPELDRAEEELARQENRGPKELVTLWPETIALRPSISSIAHEPPHIAPMLAYWENHWKAGVRGSNKRLWVKHTR